MKLSLVTVGKVRDRHLASCIVSYAKRLRSSASFRVTEVKEARGAATRALRQERESAALLAEVPRGAVTVALDERGVSWRSVELAERMERSAVRGRGHWVFLLGGADGHTANLRETCDHVWSLSPLTFPHELCRLLVTEQLYRAVTIQRGEPYHRED